MAKTERWFWLSFADSEKPTGQQFLGACIVNVTTEQATTMKAELAIRFPRAGKGAEWIAAASRNAHRLGINPGGQMLSVDITRKPRQRKPYPVNTLMSMAEIAAFGPVVNSYGEPITAERAK